MKKTKSAIIVLLLVVLTFSTSCKSKKTISMGKMDGNTYKNDYFGLSLEIPNGWIIASDEEKAALTNTSKELIANGDENLKKDFDLAKVKTLNLVYSFKHPLNYTGGFNSNFFCVAENLSLINSLTVKSGADYLKLSKALMEKTNIPYSFHEITSEEIGGKHFDVMEADVDYQGIKIYQKYYSAIIDRYALSFIMSYTTEDDLNELNNILTSIKFE